jgi:putative salt-induced outer membrane protein YdiY
MISNPNEMIPFEATGKSPNSKIDRIVRSTRVMAVLLILGVSPLLAQRTDVVILNNGDKITGEIKKLDRGKLEFRTEDAGRIYFEWIKISRIWSSQKFHIEMEEGERFVGSLEESTEDGKLAILTDTGRILADLIQVVRIFSLESSFFDRLMGYLDFGFGYQKANHLLTLSLGTEITYHTKRWQAKLAGSSNISSQTEAEGTSKNDLAFQTLKFLPERWAIAAFTGLEQNKELSLDLRASLGGGFGRHIIQTNRMLLLAAVGANVSSEKYTGSDSAQFSSEAIGGIDFQTFRFDDPELDFTASLKIYPSLTDLGRVRIQFDSRIKYEVLRDFYFVIGVYDYFDSRPPVEASKNDFGTEVTISWQFK